MKLKIIFFIFLVYFIRLVAEENEEETLQDYFEKAKQLPTYVYPYKDLPGILEKNGIAVFPLFSYGSLMNKESAQRTLSETALVTRNPAIAFGLKRVFDRDVPIQPNSRWGVPSDPNARAMLNVHPSEKLEDFVNGVLIDLPLEDIAPLLDREKGYDLIPVVVTDWNAFQKGEEKYTIAYTLSASAPQYIDSNIFPRPGYYELTRQAAKDYGPLFEALWFSTTYLADSVSPITIWEKEIQKKDSCE